MKFFQLMRKYHRTIAPVVLLPLLLTVCTGLGYRLGRDWLGLSRDQVHFLMSLHEGEYLGPQLKSFYVLANGLGVLWMLITGATMVWQNLWQTWLRWRRASSSNPQL